jgi:hypothetical protein
MSLSFAFLDGSTYLEVQLMIKSIFFVGIIKVKIIQSDSFVWGQNINYIET